MNSVLLYDAGIDYNKGVERFMDNAAVYERLLRNFPGENKYEQAFEEYERGDFDAMFASLHSMKSTTGTLDMTALYNKTVELVEILRAGRYSDADPVCAEVKELYYKAVKAIENA